MPPYSLITLPPGDFSNMFDYQAINMAAAHNTFIQGLNAIIYHGPKVDGDKVQPFMVFCLALLDNIHHHHSLEEEFYFPAMEEKLGKGALSGNVDEHKEFVPRLESLDDWCKKVQKGEVVYDGKVFIGMVEAFADTMVEHMNHELSTLDRDVMKEKFTIAELKAIDNEFMQRALKTIDFYKTLPLSVVCANPSTPWFPPFPAPLKWATRWWFAWRYSEAWQFGPMDFSGQERPRD